MLGSMKIIDAKVYLQHFGMPDGHLLKKNFLITAFAWCLPTSINLYKKKGFTEGEPAVYMEKEIK